MSRIFLAPTRPRIPTAHTCTPFVSARPDPRLFDAPGYIICSLARSPRKRVLCVGSTRAQKTHMHAAVATAPATLVVHHVYACDMAPIWSDGYALMSRIFRAAPLSLVYSRGFAWLKRACPRFFSLRGDCCRSGRHVLPSLLLPRGHKPPIFRAASFFFFLRAHRQPPPVAHRSFSRDACLIRSIIRLRRVLFRLAYSRSSPLSTQLDCIATPVTHAYDHRNHHHTRRWYYC